MIMEPYSEALSSRLHNAVSGQGLELKSHNKVDSVQNIELKINNIFSSLRFKLQCFGSPDKIL